MGLVARTALNVTNENGPRLLVARAGLGGGGIVRGPAGAPRVQCTLRHHILVPAPSRLHLLHTIMIAGVVNGWLTPIWQNSGQCCLIALVSDTMSDSEKA